MEIIFNNHLIDEMTIVYLTHLADADLDTFLYGAQLLSSKFNWRLIANEEDKCIYVYNVQILPKNYIYAPNNVLSVIEPVIIENKTAQDIKTNVENKEYSIMSGSELWTYYNLRSNEPVDSFTKFIEILKLCGFQQKTIKIQKSAKRCYAFKNATVTDLKLPTDYLLAKNGFGKYELLFTIKDFKRRGLQ